MKRDMDKVRGVLLAIEDMPGPFMVTYDLEAIGGTEDGAEAVEYIAMLHSAGYLESTQRSVYRLSWAGHDFLDSVRDEEVWRKTKEGARKVGGWTFGMLGEIAKGVLKAKASELGIPID